jgi:imidazoleglycerol-phosphate dehydratase
MSRQCSLTRKTNETEISLSLSLEGLKKVSTIDTGCGFLDHMLTLFARHGAFDLDVKCVGDTNVDYHHTVEDIGIVMGKAFRDALGDMRGITRYGSAIIPMDEALILCAVDISGRSCLVFDVDIPTEKVGDFDTELVEEFMSAFVRQAGVTIHLKKISGSNSHHIIEGAFKSFARAMKVACAIDDKNADEIPSTKGVL